MVKKIVAEKESSAEDTSAAARSAGNAMEAAMADAVKQVSLDSEAIWADESLSDEDKRAKIAAINEPDAVKARMMAARDGVKASLAAQAEKDADAPEIQ